MFSRVLRGGVVACWSNATVLRINVPRLTRMKTSVTLLSRERVVFGFSWSRVACTWPNECFPPPIEWGYEQRIGPATWPKKYPPAGGSSQSPVDIKTELVQLAPELREKPLVRNYASQICKSIVNSGCGWRVDIDPESDSTYDLSGGPLDHKYKFAQFHCHWGHNTGCGSEHTVDGKEFAGELHFVHWNTELYSKCADAVSAPKGLTVLAVFLEVGEPNSEFEKLCKLAKNIPFKDQRTDLPSDFDPRSLFPDHVNYWTYEGSLTTPPCYESVTWVVYKQPITVSEEQLESFRSLHCHCDADPPPEGEFKGVVKQNFRPPQDLNERVIRECSYS